ncbi:MAG: macro domain-containing protein [Candidatus Omnitrophota bacterium]|jgi:O-acetyl-ADP-ribose deacetylase (regulator of RNase III)/ADP-ribose pyrophosphatase YjhB (NUDIX family)
MKINNTEIKIIKGDITEVAAEAIVNPAHYTLRMDAGLSKELKDKGGELIERDAAAKGPLKPGNVVFTPAGNLSARYVIHAVTMGEDNKADESSIRCAFRNALHLADELRVDSIAFPALGYGKGIFPAKASAKIMAQEVLRFARDSRPRIKEIVFCLSDKETFDVFNQNIFGYLDYILNKLKSPFLTVDAIIEVSGGVVLILRSNPPFGFALPGGFVDYGESLEEAVIREAKEETGLDLLELKQFHTYSDPARDPRFHTVTTVFTARAQGRPQAGDDAASVKVVPLEEAGLLDFAFNHKDVLRDYLRSREGKDPF